MDIWYVLWLFGIFFPILVFWTLKNLATLVQQRRNRLRRNRYARAGRPDLDEFSPIRQLFSLAVFENRMYKIAQAFGLIFYWYKLCINFDKNWAGQRFGLFFHKLIWSPCQQEPDTGATYYCRLPKCHPFKKYF
jgi:hypothetical protein